MEQGLGDGAARVDGRLRCGLRVLADHLGRDGDGQHDERDDAEDDEGQLPRGGEGDVQAAHQHDHLRERDRGALAGEGLQQEAVVGEPVDEGAGGVVGRGVEPADVLPEDGAEDRGAHAHDEALGDDGEAELAQHRAEGIDEPHRDEDEGPLDGLLAHRLGRRVEEDHDELRHQQPDGRHRQPGQAGAEQPGDVVELLGRAEPPYPAHRHRRLGLLLGLRALLALLAALRALRTLCLRLGLGLVAAAHRQLGG